jgi:hypothetical protein
MDVISDVRLTLFPIQADKDFRQLEGDERSFTSAYISLQRLAWMTLYRIYPLSKKSRSLRCPRTSTQTTFNGGLRISGLGSIMKYQYLL